MNRCSSDGESYQSDMLSNRGNLAFKNFDFLTFYLNKSYENPFHPEKNPTGLVNLANSINGLVDHMIENKMCQNGILKFESAKHQHYFNFSGNLKPKEKIAAFLNRYFQPFKEINTDNLVIMNGSAACLDSLSFALFDPGDIFLTPTPTYSRIFTDFNDRSLAQPMKLVLPEGTEEVPFKLTAELLENRILQLQQEGKKVKGFVLINPSNPLGDIYPQGLVRKLLEICARYKIHVVVDEIYMLSVFKPVNKPQSVLSLADLPDPNRTHVVYSVSKDFSLPGLRVGFIWTQNSAVLKVLDDLSCYNCVPSIIQDAVANILTDYEWLDKIYLPNMRRSLLVNYKNAAQQLRNMGAIVRPTEAGFFIWCNFKKFLRTNTKEAEYELFQDFYKAGVIIVPGSIFYCQEPGWYRIIFATPNINEGLKIMKEVLNKKNCPK